MQEDDKEAWCERRQKCEIKTQSGYSGERLKCRWNEKWEKMHNANKLNKNRGYSLKKCILNNEKIFNVKRSQQGTVWLILKKEIIKVWAWTASTPHVNAVTHPSLVVSATPAISSTVLGLCCGCECRPK